jgi:hypothetical protein
VSDGVESGWYEPPCARARRKGKAEAVPWARAERRDTSKEGAGNWARRSVMGVENSGAREWLSSVLSSSPFKWR